MSKQATDNSHIDQKVALRLTNLPDKEHIRVLDCFAGYGRVWDAVKRRSDKKIDVLAIEKRKLKERKSVYLCGDNMKFMQTFDLNVFDIIDLDDYGFPYEQLDMLFRRRYRGIVFITFGATGGGELPHALLNELGYTNSMISKIKLLFSRDPFKKVCQYLAKHGVVDVEYVKQSNVYYLKIDLDGNNGL